MFLATILNGQTYQEFLKENQTNFVKYQDDTAKEFQKYENAYKSSYKQFTNELNDIWPSKNGKQDITSKHKYVQYSTDLKKKRIVDYENQEIELEVVAKSQKEAKILMAKMFNDLLNEDVKTAYKNDRLENKIIKKLKIKQKKIKNNNKIIADMISKKEAKELTEKLKLKKLKVVKYKGKFIYKANLKLPSNAIIKKAKAYKTKVFKESSKEKIPAELIYAIMHSESSFNPMARSGIPAFGLMQIVPRSAGVDSYKYLYNKKRILSSSYLYNSNNNIKIGTAYLHILYYKYLKHIKNPTSRLYCTIAAYNTGAGNVAKAFVGNTNIYNASKVMNNMNSAKVYKRLMKKLPYNETKHYLKKVNQRVHMYNLLLSKG